MNKLFTTQPFRRMWCAINVHRVDLRSDESGTDEPATCADGRGTGSGVTRKTYFDSSFCRQGQPADCSTAPRPSRSPRPSQRSPRSRPGSSSSTPPATAGLGAPPHPPWFSLAATADEIGVHELCHSAFGLADEYGDKDANWTLAGGEPKRAERHDGHRPRHDEVGGQDRRGHAPADAGQPRVPGAP